MFNICLAIRQHVARTEDTDPLEATATHKTRVRVQIQMYISQYTHQLHLMTDAKHTDEFAFDELLNAGRNSKKT